MQLTSALLVAALLAGADGKVEHRQPLLATVDLDRGESQEVQLADGSRAKVKLLDVQETRDSLRSALRLAQVKVEINGSQMNLTSGNYRLPVTVAGVQIDCPATKGLYRNHDTFEDSWGLDKDARVRLWPEKSPWLEPGTFVYPAGQRWFAGPTQIGNEPSYVDGGDRPPAERTIYYHSGNDIGGCEGMVDVMSACDGLVVSARGKAMPEHSNAPFYKPRGNYDYVYVLDAHGWYYRYAHLKSIHETVQPGKRVKMGQKIGVLGKEGSSGGWAHLHFDIKAKQPSGKWGIQDAYPFLWEAYRREHMPRLVAMARPHHLIATGEKVTLDGLRSWSTAGGIARYQWTFGDGSTAEGATVERTYEKPGSYSEVLKVTDAQGRIDYDFAMVQVLDKNQREKLPPTIHASYAPTFTIRAGDPVTFKVRTFRADIGNETWDFGDGSEPTKVRSDGNAKPGDHKGYAEAVHRFDKAGHYVVRVEGTGHAGMKATAHLQVRVAEKPPARPHDTAYEGWLDRKILPETEAQTIMHAFVEKQIQPLPLPKTKEQWLGRRDKLRAEILAVLGIDDLVPPKWDLKLTNQGTIKREGYRIEKLTFESYPGKAIAALLYLPEEMKGRRVPGIVSISGHTNVSKAADYVQQRNVNLALRGCVVLDYDYYGYGDSRTGDDPNQLTGANSHDIRTFSFSRRSATSLEVLDAIRALDVLTARPEVDPERIGFTGESGGSNTTYWVSALDARVKLAVAVCSVSTFDYWIRTDANWDWHQRPPGIRRIADIGTLLALHAPNPLVVITSKRGTDDEEFPLDEAEKSYRWAKHVYDLLDAEDTAALHFESTTAHGYQEDKRERLYRAVERWLRPAHPKNGKELGATIEKVEDLHCTLPEKNHTFRSVYVEWLKPLPRTNGQDNPAKARAFLRERLGWPQTLPAVKAERVGKSEKGPWSAEFWILESELGIRLPAMRIGKKDVTGSITLVPGRDKAAIARALAAGRCVLALDLRGAGEMRHGKGGIWQSIAGPPWSQLLDHGDASWCNWSWFAGRPVAGQWALDLVQAGHFCRDKLSASAVALDAENAYGWLALLAGAAAPDVIASGSVHIPRASLHEDVHARGDNALADVPGLLEILDIPELRAMWPGGTVKVKR